MSGRFFPGGRAWPLALAVVLGMAAGCSSGAGDGSTVVVRVGYQSKTINTINAGTLLRERGSLEATLKTQSATTGKTYTVEWQDFPSGAPLTAQMIAEKVDIGSMGDYPLLVNGSKTSGFGADRSVLVGVTGYNLRGSLNQIVVPPSSPAKTLSDLRGQVVSTSLGSAGHGMLVDGLQRNGMAATDVQVLNQEPAVGASAIEGGQVAGLAQFVPWPQLLVFRGQAKLLYDGGDTGRPTFHGVVARQSFGTEHPEVMQAFMQAVRDTSDYIERNPLEAAEKVSQITGIEPEVIYLYNGPNGLVTFDPTIKQPLVDALKADLPFLKQVGSAGDLDVDGFVDETALRAVYGADYDAAKADMTPADALAGTDPVCGVPLDDPATASEVWFAGDIATQVAATPTCAMRAVEESGKQVRAAYVPDTSTGTRLFASSASWVLDPAAAETARLLPFATDAAAQAYLQSHPGTRQLDYAAARTTA
ncbi:ABC transporter substrate-binding protein [Pseudonocardia sp. GCM10023141]|uniref:ABC transporter substrate-binding protein n=1 Tax=Pseudonocardia sp. GCM10023141 TaxID=3252653 RepID=UPI0036124D0A